MALLHCSAALLVQLDPTPGIGAPPASAPGLLGDWFATKFALDTRQAVLLASQRTFLSFIVLEGVRLDAEAMAKCFWGGLGQVLNMEGYPPTVADRVVDSYSELVLARAGNASVTSQMNHLPRAYKHLVRNAGGLERCDVGSLIRSINHRPRKDLGFASPREATASALGHKIASANLSAFSQKRLRFDRGLFEDRAQRTLRHIAAVIRNRRVSSAGRTEPDFVAPGGLAMELETQPLEAAHDIAVTETRESADQVATMRG